MPSPDRVPQLPGLFGKEVNYILSLIDLTHIVQALGGHNRIPARMIHPHNILSTSHGDSHADDMPANMDRLTYNDGTGEWEASPVDAADVTYTPAVATDWDGDADPGDTNDALDQLAERVDDLEAAGGAALTVEESDSSPSVANVSTLTLPPDSMVSGDPGEARATRLMPNPMRANGDTIYNLLGTLNRATAAQGATASAIGSIDAVRTPDKAIDENDATYWNADYAAHEGVVGDWLSVDLGAIRLISQVRMLQFPHHDAWGATQYKVQTSANGADWDDLVTHDVAADDETYSITATASRYWRVIATAGGANNWGIYTLELRTIGTGDGIVERLPGNTAANRKFLVSEGTGAAATLPFWDTLESGDALGAYILIASQNGCALDTDLDTGGGTDDTAAVQAMLNVADSGGRVLVIMDGPALVSGINVYSNTTILCLEGGGFYLKNTSNRAIVRNVNRSRGAITDEHIALIGGKYNANQSNQTGVTEADGTYLVGTQFFGVNYLTLRDIQVVNHRIYANHLANVNYVTLDSLRTDYSPTLQASGQDGVHINGPASFVYAHNIKVKSGDDAFAINAGDADVVDITIADNLGPYVGQGLITDIIVDGLELEGCKQGIRLLSHDSNSRINRVTVRNVRGTVTTWAIANLSMFGAGAGDFGTVVLSDWDVVKTATSEDLIGTGFSPEDYQNYGIGIAGVFESLTIRNLKIHQPSVKVHTLWICSTATIDVLTLDGFAIYDDAAGAASSLPIRCEGYVKHLVGTDWHWYRSGVAQATLGLLTLANAASQIDMLMLNGVAANLCDHIVDHTAGTLTRIQAVGIRHQDGVASFNTSGTVAEIDLSNYYKDAGTILSGTFTVQLGDAFEGAARAANLVHAGPASGAAAVPTWRALVDADLSGVSAGALTTIWEPITNGDSTTPELIFSPDGDVIMAEA